MVFLFISYNYLIERMVFFLNAILCNQALPANNDPWFHMFCKRIHEFNWLNSRVSVREFAGFCEQIWCVDTCLLWNHELFTWWHIPVKPYQFWPSTTRVNSFKTRDNTQNTCIHVNTHVNTYWWSSTNYEPVCHVPTGSEMVPCLLGWVKVEVWWEWNDNIISGF